MTKGSSLKLDYLMEVENQLIDKDVYQALKSALKCILTDLVQKVILYLRTREEKV